MRHLETLFLIVGTLMGALFLHLGLGKAMPYEISTLSMILIGYFNYFLRLWKNWRNGGNKSLFKYLIKSGILMLVADLLDIACISTGSWDFHAAFYLRIVFIHTPDGGPVNLPIFEAVGFNLSIYFVCDLVARELKLKI